MDEGRIADQCGPGRHTLTTQTLPVLTYLKNWDKFFESPLKSDVYFYSTRLQLNRKWGTANPITIRDKEFGAVRLRAFGAGLGAGMSIGQSMASAMTGAVQGQPAAQTPSDVTALLEKLHDLMTKGVITKEEFDAKKADLLKRIG